MNPFDNSGDPNDPNNAMFLQSLEQVNQQNFPFFLMQNPFLVEQSDEAILKKSGKYFVKALLGSIIGGVFLNLQLKRIRYGNFEFTKIPFILRHPIRLGVFALPFLGFYLQTQQQQSELIYNTQRTKDLRHLDPKGILAREFKDRMKQM
ncbi:hypothetical protein pb186bvf_001917 [Paramecium bursaria]